MSELEMCRQNARILQGKYQDTAAALDRAHRERDRAHAAYERQTAKLVRIAARHADDGRGHCSYCWDNLGMDGDRRLFPCPDYRDATATS